MPKSKYYDYINDTPLDLKSNDCNIANWDKHYKKFQFVRHPKGFKIFLPPENITEYDEYQENDPYTLEQNLHSEFHNRRIELTINLLQKAVSSTKNTPHVLDLGCGQGHITEAMRQKVDYAEYTGLDYSVSAIEYANDHFPHIDFSVGNAYDTPYSKKYFDVIVCNNLWEHIPDPLNLLVKIKEILKPNGYIILSTPSRYNLGNIIRVITGKPTVFQSSNHVTEYTIGQVIEQFRYGGFKVEMILTRPNLDESLKSKFLRKFVTTWASIVNSHHQSESTVFYLAKNLER